MHSSNLGPGIRQVKPGNKIGDIGHAIERVVRGGGYRVVPELTGTWNWLQAAMKNSLRLQLWKTPHNGPAMKPGLTIAIEPNSRKR